MTSRDVRQKPIPSSRINWAVGRTAGLVGAWDMLEGGGLSVHDYAGLYGPGTIQNPSGGMWEQRAMGSDIALATASSQFIQVPNNANYTFGTSFTCAVWVWQNSNRNFNGLLTKTNGNTGAPFDMYIASGTLNCFYNGTNGGSLTVSGLAAATWLHIVFVVDSPASAGGNQPFARAFVNGVLRASAVSASTFNLTTGTNNVRIGTRSDGATNIDGKFASARLWNRALRDAEVQQEYVDPWGIYRFRELTTLPTPASAPSDWPSWAVESQMPQLQVQ